MAAGTKDKELLNMLSDRETDVEEQDEFESLIFLPDVTAATEQVIEEADTFLVWLKDSQHPKESWWANPVELSILVAAGFGSYAYYAGCLDLGFFPEAFKIFAGINSLTWSAVGPAGMGRDIVDELQPSSEEEKAFLETVKKSRWEKIYQKAPYLLGAAAAIPITALTLFEVEGEPGWEQIFWIVACYVPTAAMMTYSLLKLMHSVPNELTQSRADDLALDKEEMKLLKRIRAVMLSRLNANEGLLGQADLAEVKECIALLMPLLSKPTLQSSKKLLFSLAMGALVAVIGLIGYTADTTVFFNRIFHINIELLDSVLKGGLTAVAIIPFANLMFGSVQKVISSVYGFANAWSEGEIKDFIKERILLYSIFPKSTLAIIGSICILGLLTGFTNGNNSKEMTPPFIKAIVTFIKEIISLVTQNNSYDSSDGYMGTDYLSEGTSYWDGVEGIVSWIVAGCAAATSISFNIFYSIVAVLYFTLVRAKWFSSDKILLDKADLIVDAKKFIAALSNVSLGKLMLLLQGFDKEVIWSILKDKEVNIANDSDEKILGKYYSAISKVEEQRERISSNPYTFLPSSNSKTNDEEQPLYSLKGSVQQGEYGGISSPEETAAESLENSVSCCVLM